MSSRTVYAKRVSEVVWADKHAQRTMPQIAYAKAMRLAVFQLLP
jgi:hypothetical protein